MEECSSSIYVWGSSAHGALGCQGKQSKVQLTPQPFSQCCRDLHGTTVTHIVAGNGVTTLVTDQNEAFSWGNSSLKHCTVKTKKGNACQCSRIPLDEVAVVAHGGSQNIAVNEDGEVYGWGEVSHCFQSKPLCSVAVRSAAARSATARKPRKLPIKLEKNSKKHKTVTRIACGDSHTCILSVEGKLAVLGKFRIEPTSLLNNIGIKEISCGMNHIACICSSRGSLYTWGWGKNGRLGHGNETPLNEPTRVTYLSRAEPFSTVACGYAHTLVSSEEDGSVYGFGWNAHSQILDTGSVDCLLPIMCLEKKGAMKLSCGFAHSAAVVLNGGLFSWGMNEDGQCGSGNELNVPVPTQIDFNNTIDQHVVDVSCGHSHTVCILSSYNPVQWASYIHRLRRKPSAAVVIGRFGRRTFFRIRLQNQLNQNREETEHIEVADAPSEDIDQETVDDNDEHDMSSSLSSHTSLSGNLNETIVEKQDHNDPSRRLIEMTLMEQEDIRSQAYISHLRAMQKEDAEKKRAQIERDKMQQEDILSRAANKQSKQKDRYNPTKSNMMKSRANAEIQKAVDRLREARERKERESKAKFELPKIIRKQTAKMAANRPPLNPVTSSNQAKFLPDTGHYLQRREKLLKRREQRIRTNQQHEKEADIARRRRLKEQQDDERLDTQRKQKMLSDERNLREEARRTRQQQRTAEMQRLEKELLSKKSLVLLSGENKENESDSFKPLSHWTRNLYGQM